MALFRLGQRVEGWVRWSNPVCATLMLRKPGPMSLQRTSETSTGSLAVGPHFRDVVANPHPRPLLELLERVIEIGDSRFSAL
jgi:hypothetical protein